MFKRLPAVFHGTPNGTQSYYAHRNEILNKKAQRRARGVLKPLLENGEFLDEDRYQETYSFDAGRIPFRARSIGKANWLARIVKAANDELVESGPPGMRADFGLSFQESIQRNYPLFGMEYTEGMGSKLSIVVVDVVAKPEAQTETHGLKLAS